MKRNVLCNSHDQGYLGFNGFLDGFSRVRSSDINGGGIWFQLLLRVSDGGQDGQAQVLASTSGLDAAYNIGAVGERFFGILGRDLAGEPLVQDSGVISDLQALNSILV